MISETTFNTNSIFKAVTYDKDTDTWNFYFADSINAAATGFWRLIKADKIIIVSLDNGHQFGLSKPLDLVEEVSKQLTGKYLTEIKVDKDTADLTLLITDDIRIEIFIASTGYETYEFEINNKRHIGLGSGDLAILDKNNKIDGR